MKRNKIFALTLCAAMLISGCNANTSAPAVLESETTTSAAETTKKEETTTGAATSVEMTAEPEKESVKACITPTGSQTDERDLMSGIMYDTEQIWMNAYSENSDEMYNYYFSPSGKKWQAGSGMMTELVDISGEPDYPTEEIFMKLSADDDGNIPVITHRGASFYSVRESSGVFSVDVTQEAENRIKAMPMTDYRGFHSEYEIWWCDAIATVTKPDEESREFGKLVDLSLGCTVPDVMTVNAFVCRADDERLAILIDPAYMHGIPLFSKGCYRFKFGDKVVLADSVLVYSYINDVYGYGSEIDKIPENGYGYAEVTLMEQSICWDHNNGYESGRNVGQLTNLRVLDTFTDIRDFEYHESGNAVDTVKEDAQMSLYYGALDRAYGDIYTENTVGLKLVDLNFDSTPEVIVTRLNKTGDIWWEWELDVDIYRFTDTSLKKLGTLPLNIATADSCGGYYIGKCSIPEGIEAWFASFRKSPSTDADFGEGEYMFGISGDSISFSPLFTSMPAGDDSLTINGQKQDADYFFMGKRIEPTADESGSLLTWEGITVDWGGMLMLYGTAREKFCREYVPTSVCLIDGAFSNLIAEHSVDKTEIFVLDESAYRNAAATEVSNWCTFGDALKEHIWSFLI